MRSQEFIRAACKGEEDVMVQCGRATRTAKRQVLCEVARVNHFPEGGIAPGMCQARIAQPIKGLSPIGHAAGEAEPPDAELPSADISFLPLRSDQDT
jgi:hypothetical protein